MSDRMNGAKSITRRSLLGAAGALSATAFLPGGARAAAPLRLLTNWFAQAEHGGFYQAQATGLYGKTGLDVSIGMGGAQVNTIQLLLAGRCDVVLAQPEQVLAGLRNSLPLVAIGTTFQKGLGGLMTHPDITNLAQLRGHPILISAEGRTSFWPWLRRTYGFTEDQAGNYTFNIQPFLFNPRLAMQSFATSEPYAVEQKKVPYRFFLFSDLGFAGYGNILVTTRDILQTRAPALAGFLHASMQGWKAVLDGDTAPARAAIMRANPAMTADQIDWSFNRLKELHALGEPGQPMGRLAPERLLHIRDMAVSNGVIPESLDWKPGFTTQFNDAMDITA